MNVVADSESNECSAAADAIHVINR